MTIPSRSFTLVSFHAHPDDEALLTAGTLARAVREGHRVVIVVATAGGAGLASRTLRACDLATTRTAELAVSAAAIGAHRVEVLGYADSGYPPGGAGPAHAAAPVQAPERFADADVEHAARRLSRILTEERADAVTVYDPAGGYGHPDHVQVHRVGTRAAQLAGTPLLLEATIDRRPLLPLDRALRVLSRFVPLPDLPDLSRAYTAHGDVTHRVDVRDDLDAKLAAMAAHASQATADEGVRTLALLLRLPGPLTRRVLGAEWFREVGRAGGEAPLDDIFASLRSDTLRAVRRPRVPGAPSPG